jgi:hypothetical protein
VDVKPATATGADNESIARQETLEARPIAEMDRRIIRGIRQELRRGRGPMRRVLMIFALAGITVMAGAASAMADAVYHSQHIALAPVGAAPLRSGYVENIHANGPNVYAHEQYVVNGAQPDTSYQVVLMVFASNTTCSGNSLTIPTAVINTNVAGNGNAYHVFTPADADGLRGLTVSGKWFLMDGNTAVYATSCGVIHLD